MILAPYILASIVITAAIVGWFRVGAQGDDLTPDQIINLGDPRQADVLNTSFHNEGVSR